MLISKKEKLKSLSSENEGESLHKSLTAFEMPALLSTITTGLDVHQVDLWKLVDAAPEWNFYSPLSSSKMIELVESIRVLGLMHPLVVWEQMDGSFMILSGHNRKKAYDLLLEETSDDKFKKIYCYVKKFNDLTEDEAKEIIIDTNWVQRELSSTERAQSIFQKYTKLRSARDGFKNKNYEGKTRDLIAKQFEITGRQVSDYYRLNYLSKEFKAMLEDNKLSIKAGVRLAQFNPPDQKYLYNTFKNTLDNKVILKLSPSFSKEEINQVIEDYLAAFGEDMVQISYKLTLPLEQRESFEKDMQKVLNKYGINQ